MQRRQFRTTLVALALGTALLLAADAAAAPPGSVNLRRTITAEVAEKTKGAIVNLSTTTLQQVRRRMGNDPFWDPFFGTQVVQVPVNSLGSGFVIHPDGYVVTNNHVVDRAREVTVELADGRKMPAELVSSDPDSDLAILRIRPDKPLPVLELGDSGDLMIGEPAIAIGNPLGFSHSVSTGIVSAVHRDLKDEGQHVVLRDLVQTDAAINPGNSGGPLLNAYGQVIGINTAIRGDAQNIGFAIPINKLRDLIPDLMNPAQVNRVDVGLRLKETRRLTPPAGVRAEVRADAAKPDSPAVTRIDGRPVGNIVDAYAALLRVQPGQTHAVLTLDDGTEVRQAVRAVPLPDAVVQARKQLGVTVEPLTPMLAEKYGMQTEQGLLVTEVARDSVSAKAGIEPGDVIIRLGRYPINTLDDLAKLLPHLPRAGRVPLGVVRGDQTGYGILQFGT